MRKVLTGLVMLLTLCLVGCRSESNSDTDWLEGDWYSAEWDVTYEIEESNDHWTIEEGNAVQASNLTLTQEEGYYILTDGSGVEYRIEKISDSKMVYQQLATDGQLGTTAAVEFEKVDD